MGLKSHISGRAGARHLKTSPAGPGAGWARRGRPGPARPHLRELAPPAKTVGFEILDFLQFEDITKRDIKRDISTIFVRNGMSGRLLCNIIHVILRILTEASGYLVPIISDLIRIASYGACLLEKKFLRDIIIDKI